MFHFRPQLVDFERVEGHGFVEVLRPGSIYDLIDFSVRECIKREIKMRMCKNCGHWFALTGRTNAEYCEVTRDSKGRTCKEIGAIALWNKNKSGDEVFKIYRREYKNALPGSRQSGSTRRCSMSGAPGPGRRRMPVSVAS